MDVERKIESYINEHKKFETILTELRRIIKAHPFEETLKWGIPTYVYDKKNLVGIGAFKNHVGLWFFQGVLLKDKEQILHNAQEEKTKAMRQIHFKDISEINESVLHSYLKETIDNQKKGLSIAKNKPVKKVVLPDEMVAFFKEIPVTGDAFSKLTIGRQKEYATYISSAKKEQTKKDRLEKIALLINQGKGLHDKYKRDKKL